MIIRIINISPFVCPIYTFPLAGKNLFSRQVDVQIREKHLNRIIYKGKMPTLVGNKHFSIHFLPHRLRFFHLSTEKVRAKLTEMDIKVFILPPKQLSLIKISDRTFSITGKVLKSASSVGNFENRINALSNSVFHCQVWGECIIIRWRSFEVEIGRNYERSQSLRHFYSLVPHF